MANSSTSTRQSQITEDWTRFISRDEFETFERNVDRSFNEVGRALENLGRKIDNISSKGTDWKTIWGGLSVFTAVIFGIGTVIAWGLLTRIDSNAENNRKLESYILLSNEKASDTETKFLERIHGIELSVATNIMAINSNKSMLDSLKPK